MKMTQMIRDAALPITSRHEMWMSKNPNPQYSQEALDFARLALGHEVGGNRKRSTSYRASGTGGCKRKQQFSALGYKGEVDIDATLANIFATGNFLHLKWQMSGLTEGWLSQAEVPMELPEYDFGGTLDGILWDGSLFEFKSINSRGFSQVNEFGPKNDHVYQTHGYMLLGGFEQVSIVYEDKGTGDWREFRVERDDNLVEEIKQSLIDLNEMKEREELPEPLSQCIDKTGYQYRHCPFRNICLETK